MKLKYITVGGISDLTKMDDIIKILRAAPNAELALDAHPDDIKMGTARRVWFENILRTVKNMSRNLHLVVRVNGQWAEKFCCGNIPYDLIEYFYLMRKTGLPVIKRWQINIADNHPGVFQSGNVAKLLKNYQNHEFIFQYSPKEYRRIHRLDETGANFSVIYNINDTVLPPMFDNHPQGYAGKISPENVSERIARIALYANQRRDIWISAEKKLKNPITSEFDTARALKYIKNANAAMR